MAASAPAIIFTLKPGGKSKEKEKATPIILKHFPKCVCVLLYTLCIIKMQYIIIIIISILKEISPEHSSEGLLLKLKPILWPPDAKN